MSKKQKFIWISVLALSMMTSALMLVACTDIEKPDNPDTEQHTHTYAWWEQSAVTCENAGVVIKYCTECGWVDSDPGVVKPLGHLWDNGEVSEKATCQDAGLMTYTCTREDCGKTKTEEIKALGHKWSTDYIVDEDATYEKEGSKSKHCTNSGCNEKTDSQTIPRLEVQYSVSIKDPCGDRYYGEATVTFEANGQTVAQVAMPENGVTTYSVNSPDCKVIISGLTKGYSVAQDAYELTENQPQVTICLSASLILESGSGMKYKIGSVMYDYSLDYYDDPDSAYKSTTLKDILDGKKGILLSYYFKDCSPCKNEMPALIAASKANPDIQVLMVNDYYHGNTEEDIKNFQATYAKDSPLWFVTRNKCVWLYNYFYNGGLIGGFPTTILIDCNGQVVYAHTGGMSESAFRSAMKTYILDRYDKLHPNTAKTAAVEHYEAMLPSNKFQSEE